MPFGEELGSGVGGRTIGMGFSVNDGVRQKFTSKERDLETGLDYFEARYFAATQGRFTSPDPSYFQLMMAIDPQRFNLYAYGRNNPLKFVDPNGERVYLRGDSDWLRNNVLYEMVGGQENFDRYFQISDGQVVLREDVDLSNVGAGVQQLAALVNATDNYLYFAGTDGASAANLFQGSRNAKGELTRAGKDMAGDFTCGGRRQSGCGTIVGTAGRSGNQQPANLANGDPVFAVIAYNQNVVITQTKVAYMPADLTQIATTGCSAPECTAQKSGVGQVVRPVSFFIHESTENQAFAGQDRGLYNYQRAHLHAIHREAALRQELRITGGFSGGVLDVRIPKK
jgi:RHS repeat-associated protein